MVAPDNESDKLPNEFRREGDYNWKLRALGDVAASQGAGLSHTHLILQTLLGMGPARAGAASLLCACPSCPQPHKHPNMYPGPPTNSRSQASQVPVPRPSSFSPPHPTTSHHSPAAPSLSMSCFLILFRGFHHSTSSLGVR